MIKCKFQDIEHAAKIVGNKTLPKIVFLLDNNTSYNCWGFTAYALQLVNKLYWMNIQTMENILRKYTKQVRKDKIKPGDIVVYRDYELLHTAIVISPKTNKMIHKDGYSPLEMLNIYKSCYIYSNKANVSFRRLKEDKLKLKCA